MPRAPPALFILVPDYGDGWALKTPPRCALVTPFPPRLGPKPHSRGFWVTALSLFRQPPPPQRSVPATQLAAQLRSVSTRSPKSRCQLRNCRANCVQSMAPDPVEPSRTQRHGLSHPSMAQVGSPSSCQTKARDPGIPVGLQRPPVSLIPPSRRPRGSSQGGHAQGGSALLQPASSRARLCPAQQPHGL